MSFNLKYLEEPKLRRPVAVAGLPGIAHIGKLAVEYLIEELKAKKFAELYTDYFPGWVIREGGMIKGLKVDFYGGRPKDSKRDFILATSEAQAASSLGQYKLSSEIVHIAAKHGADTVATMAAYLTPHEEQSAVVGAATDPKTGKLLDKHGVRLLDGGMIVGMNGLLVGLAGEEDLRGFCLLGTTRGGLIDVDASGAVLGALSDILGFDLDLANLEDFAPKLPKFMPPKLELPGISEEEVSYIR
jgi:uncharacterized protein (TIGR00162 family)